MSEAWRDGPDQPLPPGGSQGLGAVLRAAASLAAMGGLESVSVGRLAAAVGVSKAGLDTLFGSKENLQLAVVDEAARVFADEVVRPALAAPPGLPQLTAVCEAFFAYLERRTFPGGCFLYGVALEMGGRPGPVGERIAGFQDRFGALIRGFAAAAVARNELAVGEDPDRLAFELNGIMLAADTNFVLNDDPGVLDLARQIVRQRLRP
ncbi:MAG: TetR/AcrR family transcriptional regulator [Actinobacteria bacterium]|nr:TetR/AcrR family transcriptional regulator [Actinomycetota bacterium]